MLPIGTILLAHRVLGLGLLISNHSRERPIVYVSRSFALAALALCGWLGESIPALSADLGPGPQTPLVEPVAPPSQWQFSFTPYGWVTSINGSATARGHTVDIDENFIRDRGEERLAHGPDGILRGEEGSPLLCSLMSSGRTLPSTAIEALTSIEASQAIHLLGCLISMSPSKAI